MSEESINKKKVLIYLFIRLALANFRKKNKSEKEIFILNSTNKILLLEPTDWPKMHSFS